MSKHINTTAIAVLKELGVAGMDSKEFKELGASCIKLSKSIESFAERSFKYAKKFSMEDAAAIHVVKTYAATGMHALLRPAMKIWVDYSGFHAKTPKDQYDISNRMKKAWQRAMDALKAHGAKVTKADKGSDATWSKVRSQDLEIDYKQNGGNKDNKDKVKAVVTSTVVPAPAPAPAPAKANTPKENVELALKILRKNLPELKGKGRKKAIDDLIYLAAGHAEVNAR
tara:strand:+ start:6922 stop:7602 length:681 start_codon:yes stop_codon:yes gene_type:complete